MYSEIPKDKFGLVGWFYQPTEIKKQIPLLIYLGGQGERINSWGLTEMLKNGYSPNCFVYAPVNQRITPEGLQRMVSNAKVVLKPSKICIFGYSLGGHQGLQMISNNPNYYSGMVCCGACPNKSFRCYDIYTKPSTKFIIYRGELESGGLGISIENFANKMIENNRAVEFISLPGIRHTQYGTIVNQQLIEKLLSL